MNSSGNVEKAFKTEISHSKTGESSASFPSQKPSQTAETIDQKAVMNKQLEDSLIPDSSSDEKAGSEATRLAQNKITSINEKYDTKRHINENSSQQKETEKKKGYFSMNKEEEMKGQMNISVHDTIEGEPAKTNGSVATVNNLGRSESNVEQIDDAERRRRKKERKRKKREKREKKMREQEQRQMEQDGMTEQTKTETDDEIDKLLN